MLPDLHCVLQPLPLALQDLLLSLVLTVVRTSTWPFLGTLRAVLLVEEEPSAVPFFLMAAKCFLTVFICSVFFSIESLMCLSCVSRTSILLASFSSCSVLASSWCSLHVYVYRQCKSYACHLLCQHNNGLLNLISTLHMVWVMGMRLMAAITSSKQLLVQSAEPHHY